MKCFLFGAFLLSLYGNIVNSGSIDDKFRQIVVGVVEGKDGVKCREPITDEACPRDDITFWLYTRDRHQNPHQLKPSDENTIRNAPFVKNQPVKLLVHGFTMNKDTAINEVLRPAYFKTYNYNIISVDWSSISQEHCYRQAALSVPTVGTCVAHFANLMLKLHNDLGKIHILGHSMGAHVTAWASKKSDKLERVTQFDPALPLFTDKDTELFTKPNEQKYNDVWHSNIGIKGRTGGSGTVDIYFNDAMDQPGCNCDASCSHLRAVEYYAETVADRKRVKAFPCKGFDEFMKGECQVPTKDSLADFGEEYSEKARGNFVAFTNPKSPFILNEEVYTNADSFNGFKKTQDANCKMSDVMKGVTGALAGH